MMEKIAVDDLPPELVGRVSELNGCGWNRGILSMSSIQDGQRLPLTDKPKGVQDSGPQGRLLAPSMFL